jgi:hypothetical protein
VIGRVSSIRPDHHLGGARRLTANNTLPEPMQARSERRRADLRRRVPEQRRVAEERAGKRRPMGEDASVGVEHEGRPVRQEMGGGGAERRAVRGSGRVRFRLRGCGVHAFRPSVSG